MPSNLVDRTTIYHGHFKLHRSEDEEKDASASVVNIRARLHRPLQPFPKLDLKAIPPFRVRVSFNIRDEEMIPQVGPCMPSEALQIGHIRCQSSIFQAFDQSRPYNILVNSFESILEFSRLERCALLSAMRRTREY